MKELQTNLCSIIKSRTKARAAVLGCSLSFYCSSNGAANGGCLHTQQLHYLSSATLHVYIRVCRLLIHINFLKTTNFQIGIFAFNQPEQYRSNRKWWEEGSGNGLRWIQTQVTSAHVVAWTLTCLQHKVLLDKDTKFVWNRFNDLTINILISANNRNI